MKLPLEPGDYDLPVANITVGKRHRKSVGDLRSLMASMGRVGLLHAIGVSTHAELIFGERRLKAAEKLGWKEIECKVFDLEHSVLAEHDENEEREDFTVSERVAIAREKERLIGNRQGQRTDLNESSGQLAGSETREEAAKAAGFSSTTQYRRAETVVDKGASGLVDAMDKGEVTVGAAATVAALPKKEQAAAVKAGTVPKVAKEQREAQATARKREIMLLLIGTVDYALEVKLRADLLVTDADLEGTVPPSCKKCWKNGPPKTGACVACERLRKPKGFTGPEPGGTPDAEPHAELRRLAAQFSGLFTKAVNDTGSEFNRRLHDYAGTCGILDHPPEKHGKAVFLPLKGVAVILDMASKDGPRHSDAEVKEAYDTASGGWIPPVTKRRRAARGKK